MMSWILEGMSRLVGRITMGKKVYVVYWPLDYDISRLQEIRTELLDTAGQKF